MCTRRMVLCCVCTHLSRCSVDVSLSLRGCPLCGRPFWTKEASCLVEVLVSRLCCNVPLCPSVRLILDLPCSSRKLFRVAVRCFLPRLSQFSPFLWPKERLKFIVLLQKVCCVERAVPPPLLRSLQKRSVSTAVAAKTKFARSTRQVDSGHRFVMDNFVHVHDVMEGLPKAFSWNSVLYSWYSPAWIKRGCGDAKILLDTEYDLRFFLFHKRGSTRVLGHLFIEGHRFCDVKANAGNAKCWVWTARGRSQGEDAETVVKFARLFPSSELAQHFKVAFDGARALHWERLAI